VPHFLGFCAGRCSKSQEKPGLASLLTHHPFLGDRPFASHQRSCQTRREAGSESRRARQRHSEPCCSGER
jgi:hypothetical protein